MRRPFAVLVVEDDPEHQLLLASHLEKNGYTPVIVEGGEQALTLAENVRIDLIVLDAGLPGMDGWETLERLRSLPSAAEIPVLMLTVESSPSSVGRGYREGAQYFVTKPYDESDLIRGIRLLAG